MVEGQEDQDLADLIKDRNIKNTLRNKSVFSSRMKYAELFDEI